jgi:hypothetical protein
MILEEECRPDTDGHDSIADEVRRVSGEEHF